MSAGLLIGVDLGTSGCKAAAFDEAGRQLACAVEPIRTYQPSRGQYEQRLEDWQQALARALSGVWRATRVAPGKVLALGLCSHWPTLALLDAQGQALRPAILWKDARGHLPLEALPELQAAAPELAAGYGPDLPFAKLLWLRQHEPESLLPTRLRWCLGAREALVFYLTGAVATDRVSAWWTGLAEARGARWHAPLVNRAGLPQNRLPDIGSAAAVAGFVSPAAAATTGLPAGIPVAIGSGDGVCGPIGANIHAPGQAVLIHGSSLIAAAAAPAREATAPGQAALRFPAIDGLGEMLYVSTPSGAAADFAASLAPERDAEALRETACALPPSPDLPLFIPHLEGMGAPWAAPAMRGAWIDLAAGHGWPELCRGVLEGIAFSGRHMLEGLSAAGGEHHTLRLAGGGARSPAMCQLHANALGRPVERAAVTEAGCLGAAMLAAAAAGLFSDLPQAMAAMSQPAGRMFEPEPAGRAVFEARYLRYTQACAWLAASARQG